MEYTIGAHLSHREGKPKVPHGDQPVGSSVKSSHNQLTMVIGQRCAHPKSAKTAFHRDGQGIISVAVSQNFSWEKFLVAFAVFCFKTGRVHL